MESQKGGVITVVFFSPVFKIDIDTTIGVSVNFANVIPHWFYDVIVVSFCTMQGPWSIPIALERR
jgi:hypothetical protein